jgi:hypothetical protein
MARIFLLVLFSYSLAVPAHALPIEPLTTVISKIVKMFGGHADDAARTVSKSVDAVPPKAPMDAPAAASGKVTQAAETIDPKYKLTEPTAQSAVDRETYKRLRDAAVKGDTNAMLTMSEMTRKGQVADKGEPYFSYWLVQAARLGGQQATLHLKSVCTDNPDKRLLDKRFDQECASF